jgi:hypothetical protein
MAEQQKSVSIEKTQEAPQTPGPILLTRRQRRFYLKQQGALKYMKSLSFNDKAELRRQNIENGRKLHQQHLDIIEKRNHEMLEAKLESLKESWTAIGYNTEEQDKLSEAWILGVVKDRETYRADRKKAKALYKEVNASFQARKK